MKYGFIGCGNMGGAIATSLSQNTKDIAITDRSGKASALATELGCLYTNTENIVNQCERIFLAVKPQNMAESLMPLQSILRTRKPLLITMAAGITISRIEELAGCKLPVIRIMPNTPVAIGCGMTLYCCNELVQPNVLEDFLVDVAPCGTWDCIPEEMIDAAGVVSGCSPAYMYMFLDAMAKGAVACGVPYEKALSYASAAMAGAAGMVQHTGKDPIALRDAVCSPGGSTLAGVKVLNEGNFSKTVENCVAAAYKRNQELGK